MKEASLRHRIRHVYQSPLQYASAQLVSAQHDVWLDWQHEDCQATIP